MPWYYVENGEQRGPVTDADFDSLMQAGKVTDDTLVWREGQPSWQPWRDAKPKPAAAVPTPGGGLICAECGKAFQPEQVIRLNDRWVCATCKPVYLQRLREGATSGGGGAAAVMVTEAQVRERDYEHDIGHYLNQAWSAFKLDPGNFIGATVLVGLCILGASMIPFGVGAVAGLILGGPLIGGLYAFYLKKIRNQPAVMGDAFSGFQKFGQLLLGHVIPSLFAWLCLVPVVIGAGIMLMTMGAFNHQTSSATAMMGPAIMVVIGVFALVGMCAAVYLQMCWVFTLWLVADKNMSFWPAMSLSRAVVNKHWWQTFLLAIVCAALMIAGLLACFVGLLVTGPVMLAMYAFAYERLFGDMKRAD